MTFLEQRIADCMARGKFCDAQSDAAYARGSQHYGEYWGRRAIDAYTRAETLSQQLEEEHQHA